MLTATVMVQYTCMACRTIDRDVQVRARRPGEDVRVWIGAVRETVGYDHLRNSPLCRSRTCDLRIPIPKDASYVGEPVKH